MLMPPGFLAGYEMQALERLSVSTFIIHTPGDREYNNFPFHCALLMLIARILFLSFMTMAGTAGTAVGGLRNVTIDDGGGDETTHIVPTYLPPERWSSGGHAMPNASLAHNRTWHDATVHPGERPLNISFSFTGP